MSTTEDLEKRVAALEAQVLLLATMLGLRGAQVPAPTTIPVPGMPPTPIGDTSLINTVDYRGVQS